MTTDSDTRRPAPPPYATIVFDCDSTLSSIEGIEDLAGDRAARIKELTDRAMDGEIHLEEVYGLRLELLEPTRADLARVGQRYIETALPHAAELVSALKALGKRVCIVSGGLLPAVRELAAAIGVAGDDVFAVDVFHDVEGAYTGFEEDSPLARSGGKLELLSILAEQGGPVLLVGDGATDLEALPALGRFVAFGGVERREKVFEGADVTCDRPDLAALLPLICDDLEVGRLAEDPAHRPLVEAALAHYR